MKLLCGIVLFAAGLALVLVGLYMLHPGAFVVVSGVAALALGNEVAE